jgi:hypothetical protein
MMGIYCLLLLWKILVYLFTVYVLFCHHSIVCCCSTKINKEKVIHNQNSLANLKRLLRDGAQSENNQLFFPSGRLVFRFISKLLCRSAVRAKENRSVETKSWLSLTCWAQYCSLGRFVFMEEVKFGFPDNGIENSAVHLNSTLRYFL